MRKKYEPGELTLMDFVRYSIHSITISTPPESYSFSPTVITTQKKVTVLARPIGENKIPGRRKNPKKL
jgi:hypothetical protein